MIQVILDKREHRTFGSWQEAESFVQSAFPNCDFAISSRPSSVDVFADSNWFDERTQMETQWPIGRITEIEGF